MTLTRELGAELGRGGEGVVHRLVNAPTRVAKIYHAPPPPLKVAKLRAMTRLASDDLLRVAAWPEELLFDDAGAVRGFVMQYVSAHEDAHQLYSPKSRRLAFPDADFRFVVRAATNLARAFAQVHRDGSVIGDVNHGNAMFARDGTVLLIDCDSFQVRADGETFSCDVGTPLFTAPELYGKAFRGLARTTDHDAFGLAVLLFHLLYLGRHPFAGRAVDDELPIERAIAESRFAYGAAGAASGIAPPPGTLPLGVHGAPIAALFERAFAVPGSAARPAAVEWIEPLTALEKSLVRCRSTSTHFHAPSANCCWCELEARTGVNVFGAAGTRDERLAKDLWEAIDAVRMPARDAGLPAYAASYAAEKPKDDSAGCGFAVVIWVGMLVVGAVMSGSQGMWGIVGTVVGILLIFRLITYLYKKIPSNEDEFMRAIESWSRDTSPQAFYDLLHDLNVARRRLEDPTAWREQRRDEWRVEDRDAERLRYLGGFSISRAGLAYVTSQDIGQLEMNGIRTARDVLNERPRLDQFIRVEAVQQLVAWAMACGDSFPTNPQGALSAESEELLALRLKEDRDEWIRQLRAGPEELRARFAQVSEARANARSRLDTAHAKQAGARQ